MAETTKTTDVKLFCAILYNDSESLSATEKLLTKKFGEIDFSGKQFSFDKTNYYQEEMGQDLKRKIISFKKCVPPENISDIKLFTNNLETQLSADGKRKTNIDPGYIDYMKVILASAKYGPHKIYLKNGIYADLTLIYSKGGYSPFNWTFPDFKTNLYHNELLEIRNIYKKQISSGV